jgi:hypothetical protein
MSLESTARLWNSLLAVHRCLSKDFVDKLQNASSISDDDIQPVLDAFAILREEQFSVEPEVFRLTAQALEDLRVGLVEFVATTNTMIAARDSGDLQQRDALLTQMNQRYNLLVKSFEDTVQQIRPLAAQSVRETSRPAYAFPKLEYVGGGFVVDSPHSTNITSNIIGSPGAIANVAQYMSSVASHVTQQMSNVEGKEQIRELVTELAQRISAIDPAVQPEKTKGMADDLKVLSDEVAKPQPRRKWYELSLEGIKEAAEAIGEIGKPVLDTVARLLPLLVP